MLNKWELCGFINFSTKKQPQSIWLFALFNQGSDNTEILIYSKWFIWRKFIMMLRNFQIVKIRRFFVCPTAWRPNRTKLWPPEISHIQSNGRDLSLCCSEVILSITPCCSPVSFLALVPCPSWKVILGCGTW